VVLGNVGVHDAAEIVIDSAMPMPHTTLPMIGL
jgi:hypothetical protein